ncbi:MAG: hypothetical protein Q7R39_08375, partial [Dehalococcoidia bacterium]|nr:hypothetical protein [Dehalococcoidia bacterium]
GPSPTGRGNPMCKGPCPPWLDPLPPGVGTLLLPSPPAAQPEFLRSRGVSLKCLLSATMVCFLYLALNLLIQVLNAVDAESAPLEVRQM